MVHLENRNRGIYPTAMPLEDGQVADACEGKKVGVGCIRLSEMKETGRVLKQLCENHGWSFWSFVGQLENLRDSACICPIICEEVADFLTAIIDELKKDNINHKAEDNGRIKPIAPDETARNIREAFDRALTTVTARTKTNHGNLAK